MAWRSDAGGAMGDTEPRAAELARTLPAFTALAGCIKCTRRTTQAFDNRGTRVIAALAADPGIAYRPGGAALTPGTAPAGPTLIRWRNNCRAGSPWVLSGPSGHGWVAQAGSPA